MQNECICGESQILVLCATQQHLTDFMGIIPHDCVQLALRKVWPVTTLPFTYVSWLVRTGQKYLTLNNKPYIELHYHHMCGYAWMVLFEALPQTRVAFLKHHPQVWRQVGAHSCQQSSFPTGITATVVTRGRPKDQTELPFSQILPTTVLTRGSPKYYTQFSS